MSSINNFYQYSESLSSGAQPTAEQIEALKAEGVEYVFNISPVSTPNYLSDEAGIVEKLGMKYIHYPIDCSNLQATHFLVFNGIMEGLRGKKVFVHCGGNIKSSNLIHMYQVKSEGRSEQESIKDLLNVQQPEQKWFEYFKSFGMEGIKA